MGVKEAVVGGVVTVIIGGSAYTVSQTDIINNFAADTGMSQQEAEKYVDDAQNNLQTWDKIGTNLQSDGISILNVAATIDCINYRYEWESPTLSCDEGKTELQTVGNSEVSLGQSYLVLSSNSASKDDMSSTITKIDDLNSAYSLAIVSVMLDQGNIKDIKNTNSYNKSVIKAAMDSK